MASLLKNRPNQPTIAIPLLAELKIRIDILLTGDFYGSALSKEQIIATWKSIPNLYRVVNSDFRSVCFLAKLFPLTL